MLTTGALSASRGLRVRAAVEAHGADGLPEVDDQPPDGEGDDAEGQQQQRDLAELRPARADRAEEVAHQRGT